MERLYLGRATLFLFIVLSSFNSGVSLAHSPSFAWNGNVNGKNAPSGVYIWQASLAYFDGVNETISGDITLVR